MNNNSDNGTDHNPFRDRDQPQGILVPDSPHVAFAARSPSIIPTPIYDDDSTISSFPISSPALSSVTTSSVTGSNSSPSLLNRQINSDNTSLSPTSPRPDINTAYGSKIQLGDSNNNNQYGPTFREDDNSVPTSSSLHRGAFVPLKKDEDEIQLYGNESKPLYQQKYHPPPEQSRVDIFMSKLKGYQKPPEAADSSLAMELEEGRGEHNSETNTRSFKRHGANDDDLVRHMPNNKQRGLLYRQLFGTAKYPLFTWISAIAMLCVFIYELVRNNQLSSSWIQTSPFNPMIGPNYMALVNMGSKFVPCMRETTQYPSTSVFGNCYQTADSTCTLEQLCGFGGFNGQAPNQTFRFFVPIFLHGGVIHILLNLLTHLQFGAQIERSIGLLRFMILYFVTGIWGFILSGVLSGLTVSSMGCSGALFGLVGFSVTDVLIRWKEIRRPGRELAVLIFTALFALVLGLFPGIDNFAHIGGFVMGLLFGVILSSSPQSSSQRSIIITWIARVIALVLAIVLFVVFLRIFYTTSDLSTLCPNCRYLSCLPIKDWCDV